MMSRKYKILIFICVCACVIILGLSSPVFAIADIEISGCESLDEKKILEAAGISKGMNIFMLSKSRTVKALKENHYIESVTITKTLPDAVSVSIVERRLSGYIEYLKGTYLYIDENGRVLEIASSYDESLPIIVGLKMSEFHLGELLKVDDKASFESAVTLTRLFMKYEMQDEIISVDISKSSDIRLYIYGIDVRIGDAKNSDEKICILKAMLEEYPDAKTIRGTLDLKETDGTYSLITLT